jgi:site-specific DNA-methyltransferase (adenine-specific)
MNLLNSIQRGDCVRVMRSMPSESVDFILTDPPYICRYQSRSGQTIANDNNDRWLNPAFAEMHRVLKDRSFCLSFYGWQKADSFIAAWRAAGFCIVGHVVFRKRYSSSVRFLRCQHEQAYLLAKGDVVLPEEPLSDVVDWRYSGYRLHPTQKPVDVLRPFVETFCPNGGLVLDPFCGSGSTLVAANDADRDFIGIELARTHFEMARERQSRTICLWREEVRGLFMRIYYLIRGLISFLVGFLFIRITISKLLRGAHIESKSLDRILETKNAIETAATDLQAYLIAAETFDGREELFEP